MYSKELNKKYNEIKEQLHPDTKKLLEQWGALLKQNEGN